MCRSIQFYLYQIYTLRALVFLGSVANLGNGEKGRGGGSGGGGGGGDGVYPGGSHAKCVELE